MNRMWVMAAAALAAAVGFAAPEGAGKMVFSDTCATSTGLSNRRNLLRLYLVG